MTAALTGAWLAAGNGRPFAISIGGAVLCGCALAAAASKLRVPAFRLRWDGECWLVSSACEPRRALSDEWWPGRLDVAVDLGTWLLLRFRPDSGVQRCPYRWLPVQRRGIEAQWHVLRATVYSARPAGSSLAPAVRDDLTE